MKSYQTKAKKLAGTDYKEVHKRAFSLYQQIKSKTKSGSKTQAFHPPRAVWIFSEKRAEIKVIESQARIGQRMVVFEFLISNFQFLNKSQFINFKPFENKTNKNDPIKVA